ncbi:MAG: DUF5658 family protein [Chloroflexi bacterium]|nr:DUF5658 family protein [Chloroflexota bacterium]
MLDLLTAVRMLVQYGPQAELNPLVRSVYGSLGPAGLAALKLVPIGVILMLGGLGLRGRPRLVRNLLVFTCVIGAMAARSNFA